MKALFIGGTGNISISCSNLAIDRGIELFHINRGKSTRVAGAHQLVADNQDDEAVERALSDLEFDCVVDWIAYTPNQIEIDIKRYSDRAKQFIFISSASVYQKPPSSYLITESTPAFNPFWEYSQKKIACERRLIDAYEETGFPVTIVRPSHTYNVGWLPTTFGSSDYTIPKRMIDGKPIVVHGDGESLWTLTHADDFAKGFVGLMGHPRTIGETFHITSDDVLSWNQIHKTIGRALGVEPKIVHASSDLISRLVPSIGPGLLGDKSFSLVFDNSKIKRYVPEYQATIPFHQGVERSLAWFAADESRRTISEETDSAVDKVLAHLDL